MEQVNCKGSPGLPLIYSIFVFFLKKKKIIVFLKRVDNITFNKHDIYIFQVPIVIYKFTFIHFKKSEKIKKHKDLTKKKLSSHVKGF